MKSSSLQVLLFAGVREAAGRETIEIDCGPDPTASDVIEHLADRLPDAAALIRISRLAVEGRYVSSDFSLSGCEGELALIPPVSGG